MKRSTKAVLLSAFVFPGVGHLYLKRFLVGILLSGGSASALYFIVSNAVNRALEIAERIQSSGVPLDVDAIATLVSEQAHGAESSSLQIATIALIAFWLIGIADSYRLSRVGGKVDDVPIEKKP